MTDPAKTRFTFIDGLRGIAAMLVVAFHGLRGNHVDFVSTDVVSLVVLGEAGVVIFFVISGFVIAHSILKNGLTPNGIGPYILRRSIRLDPPYWAAIVLALGFSVVASAVVPDRPTADYTTGQLIAHLFYAQELLGYLNVNPVFWTLCYEFQFYAVIACLLAIRSPIPLFIAFAASLLWPLGIIAPIQGLFVNLFYSFLLGVGTLYAYRKPALRPWFLAYAAIIFGAAVMIGDLFALISSVTAATLLLVAVRCQLSTLLNWRWLQFLGMISYSLYLTHNPITGATFRVWFMLAGHSTASQIVGCVLATGACILFAWMMYVAIEKPCIALARSSAPINLAGLFRRQPKPERLGL